MIFTSVEKFRNPPYLGWKRPRAGVIPYCLHQGELFFALGFDQRIHRWSDFGGGVEVEDATMVDGALRELQEETLDVLSWSSREIENCLLLYDKVPYVAQGRATLSDMVVIFVPVDQPLEISTEFHRRVHPTSEIGTIQWFETADFMTLINHDDSAMYSRLKTFLRRARNIETALQPGK